jgi:hypothetical protein
MLRKTASGSTRCFGIVTPCRAGVCSPGFPECYVYRALAILAGVRLSNNGDQSCQPSLGHTQSFSQLFRSLGREIDLYLLWHRHSPYTLYAGDRFSGCQYGLQPPDRIPSLQQPPGFAILLKAASVGGSAGIEGKAPERREGSDRDDEPRVLGDNIDS